jgi:2-phosphosulfolactate phosphatase
MAEGSGDVSFLPMRIRITDFVAGACEARGLAVIIDVFRAFSVAAHAFARGAETVIPIGSVEDARALKDAHPDWLLVGERFARRLPGFDGGNSPTEIERMDVAGRTLIHTTHAGTQGLVNAVNAEEVVTGALVNAAAIVRYASRRRFGQITLVRMGKEAQERSEEDDACADLLARRLGGEVPDTSGIRERLRSAPSARKFFDPACDWAPERDFDLCTRVDQFDFVLRLDRSVAPARLRRVDVQ